MANRLNAPNTFAALSPPWPLSSLDANATQNQAAWNDSSLGFVNGICTDTGSANAYVVSAGNLPFGAPSSYQSGMTIYLLPANTNTTASTITVGALGSASILTPAGNALNGGEINQNELLGLVYNSAVPTGFRMITSCRFVNVASSSASSVSYNVAGYSSVAVVATFTGSSFTVNLNNLSFGVPTRVHFANTSGATKNFALAGTNAAGTAWGSAGAAIPGGGNVTISGAGQSLGSNLVAFIVGALDADNVFRSVWGGK